MGGFLAGLGSAIGGAGEAARQYNQQRVNLFAITQENMRKHLQSMRDALPQGTNPQLIADYDKAIGDTVKARPGSPIGTLAQKITNLIHLHPENHQHMKSMGVEGLEPPPPPTPGPVAPGSAPGTLNPLLPSPPSGGQAAQSQPPQGGGFMQGLTDETNAMPQAPLPPPQALPTSAAQPGTSPTQGGPIQVPQAQAQPQVAPTPAPMPEPLPATPTTDEYGLPLARTPQEMQRAAGYVPGQPLYGIAAQQASQLYNNEVSHEEALRQKREELKNNEVMAKRAYNRYIAAGVDPQTAALLSGGGGGKSALGGIAALNASYPIQMKTVDFIRKHPKEATEMGIDAAYAAKNPDVTARYSRMGNQLINVGGRPTSYGLQYGGEGDPLLFNSHAGTVEALPDSMPKPVPVSQQSLKYGIGENGQTVAATPHDLRAGKSPFSIPGMIPPVMLSTVSSSVTSPTGERSSSSRKVAPGSRGAGTGGGTGGSAGGGSDFRHPDPKRVQYVIDQITQPNLSNADRASIRKELVGSDKYLDDAVRKAEAARGTEVTALSGSQSDQAKTANQVVSHLGKINSLIDNLDKGGQLGPLFGRWNEFKTGKFGAGAPADFARLRLNMGLLETALGRVHGGARGGGSTQMLQHFAHLMNADRMDAQTLRSTLGEVKEWLNTYANPAKSNKSAVDELPDNKAVQDLRTKYAY